MVTILAHVTQNEFPLGIALFLGGLGAGIGIGVCYGAYVKFFKSR
jgi:hypothetical protein